LVEWTSNQPFFFPFNFISTDKGFLEKASLLFEPIDHIYRLFEHFFHDLAFYSYI